MRSEVAGSVVREVTVVVELVCRGKGLENVKELQREQDGRDDFLGTADSSLNTGSCALKHARSSYKPALLMGSGVLVGASSEALGGQDWALAVGGGRVRGK